MRKIETQIIEALRSGTDFRTVRDKVTPDGKVYLWDNLVAMVDKKDYSVWLSDSGYSTQTTMRRLNAVTASVGLPVSFKVSGGSTVCQIMGEKREEKTFFVNGWRVTVA